jgi:integrase
MREGELYGLGEEDFDLDGQKVLRVRRQIKRIGRDFVFALPKNDRERIIPLSDWDIQVVKRHIGRYPPPPYTLPWESPDGKPHTCRLMFRWPADDQHVHLLPSSHYRARIVIDDHFRSFGRNSHGTAASHDG